MIVMLIVVGAGFFLGIGVDDAEIGYFLDHHFYVFSEFFDVDDGVGFVGFH